MEQTINFDLVSSVKAAMDDYSQLDEAYLVAHFDSHIASSAQKLNRPMRVDGMTLLVVKSGTLGIDINLDHFEVEGPSICVFHPSCRIGFTNPTPDKAEGYVLFMTQQFLQSINLNMTAFNFPAMLAEHPAPVMNLSAEELDLMERYLDLLARNTRYPSTRQLSLSIGSSIISAVIYEMARIQYHHLSSAENSSDARPRAARGAYVQDFLKLVRAHYAMERSVAFYASKLCISPKYLSLIVKEATGRSAARWIDEFVLMEAKNMLRYSGKNIQQVAYALNFTNQSSFGKYFKHLTGMSPTEYQKS